jgi:RNA polymerase sigma-70 factor (ECF subfamily)
MSNSQLPLERILSEADRLQQLAYSILRDAHGAEDVAQEASLIALDQAPDGLDDRSFRAWIGAVTRNLARNRFKGERSRMTRESEVARSKILPGEPDAADRLAAQEALAAAVLKLEDDERHLVVLRYFDELPPREIAKRTGRTPAAVSSALHRCLVKLRRRLAADGYGAPALVLVAGGSAQRAVPTLGFAAKVTAGVTAMMGWGLAAAVAALVLGIVFLGDRDGSKARSKDAQALAQSGDHRGEEEADESKDLAPIKAGRPMDREPAVAGGGPQASQRPGPMLTLQLRVTDPSGEPLLGVSVGPVQRPPSAGSRFRMEDSKARITDGDGRASLVLPWKPSEAIEGRQLALLVVSKDGWTESVLRETFDGPGEFTLDPVELQRAGSASGRVVDDRGQPVPGCFVAAVGPATPGSAEVERQRRETGQAFSRLRHPAQPALTGKDGAFQLDRIPVGNVSLIARLEGGPYGYSSPVEIRDGEVSQAVKVVLPKATAPDPPDLSTPTSEPAAAETMTVRVLDAEGVPIEEAFIACLAGPGPAYKILPARTTSTGPGQFELFSPGELFSIAANARGYEHSLAGPFEANRAPGALEITLRRSVALRGVVIDAESRRPLAGVKLHGHTPAEGDLEAFHCGLQTRWSSRESHALSVISDEEGRFTLPLPGSGERLIHAECDGYARETLGPVTIASVDTQPEPVIELRVGATLAGRLLVQAGVDPTAYSAEISHADGHLARSDISASGHYAFENLPEGPVQIQRVRRRELLSLRTRPVRNPKRAIRTQATIPKSGEVTFDLDYRHEIPVDLDLQVSLNGQWKSGWKAFLSLQSEDANGSRQSNWVEEPVPPAGRLRLRIVGSGEASLSLRRITPSFGEQSLKHSWPARAGVNLKSWSGETGSLRLTDLPVDPDSTQSGGPGEPRGLPGFALLSTSEDGWEWVERFDPTVAGEQSLPQVPVGTVEIRERSSEGDDHDVRTWRVIGEAEVRAGEETMLAISKGR